MKTNSISCSNFHNGALPFRLTFAVLLMTAVVAGACRSMNETSMSAPVPSPAIEQTPAAPTPQALKKKSAVRLPRIEAALKKAVAARLKTWEASIETRDLEKHLQHYADQIEIYYNAANTNRDFVSADRSRAFKQFDTLKLEIINVDINLETTDAAIVTFDKGWDFKKGESFSNGLVQQEVKMRKIEKQWLIVSEKDLQVYRYRNQ